MIALHSMIASASMVLQWSPMSWIHQTFFTSNMKNMHTTSRNIIVAGCTWILSAKEIPRTFPKTEECKFESESQHLLPNVLSNMLSNRS